MFPAVKADADVLCKDFVFLRVFVPVLFIDSRRAAPAGAAVFLPPPVIASGGQVNPDAQTIGGDKEQDALGRVAHPLDVERIVHRHREIGKDFGKSSGKGRGGQ